MRAEDIEYKTTMFNESWRGALAGLGLGITSLATPSQSHGQSINQLATYVMKNEGLPADPYRVYKDSKGLLTIGRGHLIQSNSRAIFNKLFGSSVDFDAIRSGKDKLTMSQIDRLFQYDLKRKITLAEKLVPKLKSYPSTVQAAIVDGVYRGDLSGSPKTLKLINAGKFKEAAREYLDNDEYRKAKSSKSGVAKRMENNARIYSEYSGKEQPVLSATTTTKQYTVKPGDSLWKISKQLDTSVKDLQTKNPRVNPNKLQIGQKINY